MKNKKARFKKGDFVFVTRKNVAIQGSFEVVSAPTLNTNPEWTFDPPYWYTLSSEERELSMTAWDEELTLDENPRPEPSPRDVLIKKVTYILRCYSVDEGDTYKEIAEAVMNALESVANIELK